MPEPRLVGHVCVDSGAIVIGDPIYIRPVAGVGLRGREPRELLTAGLGGTTIYKLVDDGSYPVYYDGKRLIIELEAPDD